MYGLGSVEIVEFFSEIYRIGKSAIKFLKEQNWEGSVKGNVRGNVRELENIFTSVTTMVNESLITVEHIKAYNNFDDEKEISVEKLHELKSRHGS